MLRSGLWPVVGLCSLGLALAGCGQQGPTAGPRADVLADGTVTAAEYRATIDGVAACLNDLGWETSQPKAELDGVTLGLSMNPRSGHEEDVSAASAAWDTCFDETATTVQRQYFKQHVPTGAARDALVVKLIDCLARVGVDGLSPANTEQEIVGAIAEQRAEDMSPGLLCLEKYSLVFPEGKVDP